MRETRAAELDRGPGGTRGRSVGDPAGVIGIDLGTSSIKGALYTNQGDLIRLIVRPIRTDRPQLDWAEQDPDEWWRELVNILDELGPAAAIAIAGQANGLVATDDNGAAVRAAVIWSDTRATSAATGSGDPTSPIARLNWFEEHEPDNMARTRWWLLPKDYLNLRLTGAIAGDAIGSIGLTDGVAYLSTLPIGLRDRLAPLRGPGERLGSWRGAAVAVGSMDSVAAVYGSGPLEPGAGFDVSGTSETVGMISRSGSHGDAIRNAIPLGPSRFLHAGPTQSGAGSVLWARAVIARDLDIERFFLEAQTAPPGANDLLFMPYLNGERAPIWNPEARGVFFGLNRAHTRADLCRAVMEGVAFSIRHVLEAIEVAVPEHAENVTCSGRAAGSPVWNQIKSDVLGSLVQESATKEAGTLGAAMVAAVAAGLYPSLSDAARAMLRQGTLYHPTDDGDVRARYDALFSLYVDLSRSLVGAWKKLSAFGNTPRLGPNVDRSLQ